jgi:ClpP class serine protease
MIFLDLILAVLLLAILVPIVRQRMIVAARMRLFHELEQQRGTRVIALIHRQESMFFLGFPVARYIDIQDSEEVLRAIQLTDAKVPIDIIL